MKKIARLSALSVLLLTSYIAHSQDFSNKGTEFWLAYSYHVGMTGGGDPTMTLYLTSDINTTYNVEIYGVATIQSGSITAGQVVTVIIPTTYYAANGFTFSGYINNKAIHVTSSQPIVIYSYITRSAVSGATLCLPTNVLGKEYYSANFTQRSNEQLSNSYITIVGVEDNTTIDITTLVATVNWASPGTYQITLNKGQIYQVLGTVAGLNGVDLTGTKIKSVSSGTGGCKRIAVFSGSGKIYIFNGSCATNTADNLYQQLYPTGSWGKKYLTVPSSGRPYNVFRITKSDPTTVVTLNGAIIPSTSFTSNIYYEFSNSVPNRIESDKPISVAQYFTTANCNGNGSPYDPDMVMLNPVEQNINKVTLVSSNLVAANPQHHIHVIMRNGGTGKSSFTLDGVAVNPGLWITHTNDPNYSYLYLTNVSQGYHKIASDSGFNALAYGYANAESYGYSAGANVKDLYQFVTIQNQYAQVNYPATCKNSPFFFSMTFPYEPASIEWQFNGLFPNVTVSSPTYDSSWIVSGKTLYRYKLPNPYIVNNTGTYPIKVLAQNPTPDGCSGVQEVPYELVVLERPTANFSFATNGCFTTPVSFTDLSNPNGTFISTWHWDFGDGTGSSGVKNPTYSYAAAGTYSAKLHIVTDVGCISDTIPKQVTVIDVPVADFTVSSPGCIEQPVTFTDTSTSAAGFPIVKWIWDFGDGSAPVIATTNATQTHIYTTPLSYTATLKVEIASGCQSIIKSKTFTVNGRLTASFDFGNACLPGGQMQFTNTTSIGNTPPFTIASCSWTFSDGGTSSNCNPLHTYTATGPYTATLTVTSDAGCTDDTTRTVATIYNPAVALFSVNKKKSCVNTDFSFTSNSSAPGNTVQAWNWDFGDGTTSLQQNPLKQYSLPGTYFIKHWISTAAGCVSDTARDTLIVFSKPIASFVVDPHRCETDSLYFTSNSTAGGANITLYNWQVNGSPLVSVGSSAKYLPASATGYSVKLTIGTEAACTDDTTINVVVNPKPIPAFNLPNVCLPIGSATFINSTTISDGTGTGISYVWNFGDPAASGSNPNTSTQKDGSHFYSSTGSYPVKLTATSSNGCVKDTTRNLTTVYNAPVAAFTAPLEVCYGTQVSYTDNSTAANNTVAQWSWSFDDGSSSNLQNPVKTFATAGTHSATLIVTTLAGCVSASVTKFIEVNKLPVSTFSIAGTTCETKNINFVNQSVANTGSIVKWTWNMGTGGADTIRTTGTPFMYVYPAAGAYHVTLVTETNKGCVSGKLDTVINVYPQPNPGFAMSENCLIDPFSEFTDTTTIADNSQASFTYLWNFGDPNANGSNPNTATGAVPKPRHIYTMVRTYPVTMTVTSNRGCSATIQQQFTINGSQPQSNFTIAGTNHCSNDSLRFINNSFADVGSIIKLEVFWDYVNNPTVKETDQFPSVGKIYSHLYPEFFLPATKNYTIRVVAYSGDSCLKDSIISFTISATPDVNFTALQDKCLNDAGYLVNTGSINNVAIVGGGGIYSGPGISPAGNFSPATAGSGTHTIRYTYTGSNGCVNFKEQPLVVFPIPTVTAGPDKLVLEGGLDTLDGAGSGNNIGFLWSPARWLSSTTIAKPKVTPLDDITYTLTVTSADGCTVSDNVLVKVLKAPAVPNVFTPNNDGVNDKWEISYLETYPGATIEVYNRYGQLVYKSVGYTKPWDGKLNGSPVPVGTYYYIINPKNGRKQVTGFVDIIR
jgi:gliding motility-associated-like protein